MKARTLKQLSNTRLVEKIPEKVKERRALEIRADKARSDVVDLLHEAKDRGIPVRGFTTKEPVSRKFTDDIGKVESIECLNGMSGKEFINLAQEALYLMKADELRKKIMSALFVKEQSADVAIKALLRLDVISPAQAERLIEEFTYEAPRTVPYYIVNEDGEKILDLLE